METKKFINLINAITGKDFTISTSDSELLPSTRYRVFRTLPIKRIEVGFDFDTPKNIESYAKTFINQYCKKYREPNPANYDGSYPGSTAWDNMTDEQRERCYWHHSNNMYSSSQLLEQIKENFNNPAIERALCRFGFYETNYGVGIFVLFAGKYEMEAIKRMEEYLNAQSVFYSNEFSNARWVYRFVINISKDVHFNILEGFYKAIENYQPVE